MELSSYNHIKVYKQKKRKVEKSKRKIKQKKLEVSFCGAVVVHAKKWNDEDKMLTKEKKLPRVKMIFRSKS